MATTEVQVGDKVRISYEGIVEDAEGSYLDLGDITLYNTNNFTVEVLEKAKPKDDPASDPVGTVRQGTYTWVKTDVNTWRRVADDRYKDSEDLVAGGPSTVIGVVPGSPAAKAEPRFKVGQRIKGDHNGNAHSGVIAATDRYGNVCAEAGLSGKLYKVENHGLISYESAQLVDPWGSFQD